MKSDYYKRSLHKKKKPKIDGLLPYEGIGFKPGCLTTSFFFSTKYCVNELEKEDKSLITFLQSTDMILNQYFEKQKNNLTPLFTVRVNNLESRVVLVKTIYYIKINYD